MTAVDASPEAIAINRARVGRANVDYVEADLFAWTPPARYDLVFMSFWLSHVPDAFLVRSGRRCATRFLPADMPT